MSLSGLRIIAGIVVWGLVFLSTLSISHVRADWGHSICGPWGCGPPLPALLACHLSWLVVLLPLTAIIQTRVDERFLQLFGALLMTFGLVGILGIITYEFFTWWPSATEFHRRYLWQRLGFAIVTQIDLPVIESIVTGSLLYIQAANQRIRLRTQHEVVRKSAVTA